MSAREPAEASSLFERYFAEGDLEGLMSLYEEGAVFPTPRGTSTGHDEIRATLKASSTPAPRWRSGSPWFSLPATWR